MPNTPIIPFPYTLTPYHFGKKHYELTDWLGNIRVVINDKKTPMGTGSSNMTYVAQVLEVNDYYPFGMLSRNYIVSEYRYGFNRKENDDEIIGKGRWQDYGVRMYRTDLGRFFSPDPLIVFQKKYPELSSYQFAGNSPMRNIDLDGLEPVSVVQKSPLVQKVVTIILSAEDISKITSGYYRQGSKNLPPGKFHGSIDIGVPSGTPVKSVAKGKVFYSGVMSGYGNVIIIKHDKGIFSLYGHLSKISIKAGEEVEQGTEIGRSGATGVGTGPHLHFEFLLNPDAKKVADLLPANKPEIKRKQKINLIEKEEFEDWYKQHQKESPVGLTKEQKRLIEDVIKDNNTNTTKSDNKSDEKKKEK